MTRTVLLERLRDLTEEATAGVLLPVRRQKGDGESLLPRPAKIYLMGLPEAGAAVTLIRRDWLNRTDGEEVTV